MLNVFQETKIEQFHLKEWNYVFQEMIPKNVQRRSFLFLFHGVFLFESSQTKITRLLVSMRDVAQPKNLESVSASLLLPPHQSLFCSLLDGGVSEMQKSQHSQEFLFKANPNSGGTQNIFWRSA